MLVRQEMRHCQVCHETNQTTHYLVRLASEQREQKVPRCVGDMRVLKICAAGRQRGIKLDYERESTLGG